MTDQNQDSDVRLLTYQVNELGKGLDDFRGEMSRSVNRIERKIDDNLETTMRHYADLEAKVQRHETWIATQREGDHVRKQARSDGLSQWQVIGIIAGIACGIAGVFFAFLAILASILIPLLHG